VSRDLLGLSDHEAQGKDGPISATSPRGAVRARQRGRAVLAILGAWPWAHAPDGRFPAGWRAAPAFTEPLNAWLDESRAELVAELARVDAAHKGVAAAAIGRSLVDGEAPETTKPAP
jgi:hypothetical protein